MENTERAHKWIHRKTDIEPTGMDKSKANTFNTFFATVGSVIQKKLNITDTKVTTNSLSGFQFKPETEDNVKKLIDRIRTNVATGIDGINAQILKDGRDIIVPTLTQIINLGYELNQFPDSLKGASVKQIYKKKSQEDPANYRPISILIWAYKKQ